ncbi:Hypothetical predicted protein [Pelobates cultripes]|uniref:Uncharacterized protein n=1 Tax=Pelobates cultripes TaxID=61616 RepID=A0AAD1SVL1_PELCU|nr:Hypothetical predicted protein [Pelobates cultripes]
MKARNTTSCNVFHQPAFSTSYASGTECKRCKQRRQHLSSREQKAGNPSCSSTTFTSSSDPASASPTRPAVYTWSAAFPPQPQCLRFGLLCLQPAFSVSDPAPVSQTPISSHETRHAHVCLLLDLPREMPQHARKLTLHIALAAQQLIARRWKSTILPKEENFLEELHKQWIYETSYMSLFPPLRSIGKLGSFGKHGDLVMYLVKHQGLYLANKLQCP